MKDLQQLLNNLFSGNDSQAEEAAGALARVGAAALAALASFRQDPDPDRRWWAVRVLAAIPDPAVPGWLIQSLTDPDPAVQQCAAMALSEQTDLAAVPHLVEALQKSDQLLARLAGNALVRAGSEAVPALLDVMEKGPHGARIEAVRALAEIKDLRAVPMFFKAVRDGDSPIVEYWADIGLERLGIGMAFFKP
jgi:HEAT repeat protein